MEAVKKKNELDMTSGKLLPKMLAFALPLMAMSVLQLLFNSADMIVVGQFDKDSDSAIAAIGSTASVVALLVNFFIGLSVGAGIVMSRAFGAKDTEKGEKVLHTSMIVGLISGIIIAVMGASLSKTIITLMKCPVECFSLALKYLVIYFLGAPFNLVYNFGAAMLRSVGDTKRPLIYLTVAGVINIIVNLIAVIVFNLSVAGVAIATVVSQAVSAALVVRALMKDKGFAQLQLSKLKIHGSELKDVLRFGVPSGIQTSLFAITNVLTQSAINALGETVMAGNSAAVNLGSFVFTIMQAVGNTAATAVGQNYGAKDFARIKRAIWLSIAMVSVFGITLAVVEQIFAVPLLKLYTSTPEAIEVGLLRMEIVVSVYFVAGMMEICNHSLRGIGYSLTPMIIALIGTCALRLLWIFALLPVWESVLVAVIGITEYTVTHQLWCIFTSWPATWVVTFIVAAIFLVVCFKKQAKKHAEIR